MNNTITLGIAIMLLVFTIGTIQDSEGLFGKKEYALYNDNAFFVFKAGVNNTISPMDGGIFYNDEWRIFDTASVDTFYEENWVEGFWINGELDSGEEYWLTYGEFNGTRTSGVFVYDGEKLLEDYRPLILSRLFF